jgi:hypothetical protein
LAMMPMDLATLLPPPATWKHACIAEPGGGPRGPRYLFYYSPRSPPLRRARAPALLPCCSRNEDARGDGMGMEFERGRGRHGINGRACPSRNQCRGIAVFKARRLGRNSMPLLPGSSSPATKGGRAALTAAHVRRRTGGFEFAPDSRRRTSRDRARNYRYVTGMAWRAAVGSVSSAGAL